MPIFMDFPLVAWAGLYGFREIILVEISNGTGNFQFSPYSTQGRSPVCTDSEKGSRLLEFIGTRTLICFSYKIALFVRLFDVPAHLKPKMKVVPLVTISVALASLVSGKFYQ